MRLEPSNFSAMAVQNIELVYQALTWRDAKKLTFTYKINFKLDFLMFECFRT